MTQTPIGTTQMDTTGSAFEHPGGMITLQNPESQNFGAFIVGNAQTWQTCALADLGPTLPADEFEELGAELFKHLPGEAWIKSPRIRASLDPIADRYVVQRNQNAGQTLVICGAGPSLRDTAAKWIPKGDQVWGCNSAAIWLHENGHRVTHAFTVDQTTQMILEWESSPPIGYLLASTVHPFLTDHLIERGRRITWFHNYVGLKGDPVAYALCLDCHRPFEVDGTQCPGCGSTRVQSDRCSYEQWMYGVMFPATVTCGSGLNATTRAIDLALYAGFSKIIVLGADCALRTTKESPKAKMSVEEYQQWFGSPEYVEWLKNHTEMHADGGNALASDASALTFEGEIDGRRWISKPDLLVTAVWLVRMKRVLGSRLSIMGDTLPKALLHKDDAFLRRLPTLTSKTGEDCEFVLPEFLLRDTGSLTIPV